VQLKIAALISAFLLISTIALADDEEVRWLEYAILERTDVHFHINFNSETAGVPDYCGPTAINVTEVGAPSGPLYGIIEPAVSASDGCTGFDGVDDGLSWDDSEDLFADDFTLTVWIKSGIGEIISSGNDASAPDKMRLFVIYDTFWDTHFFQVETEDGTYTDLLTLELFSAFDPDDPYMIGINYASASDKMELYVESAAGVSSDTPILTVIPDECSDWEMGRRFVDQGVSSYWAYSEFDADCLSIFTGSTAPGPANVYALSEFDNLFKRGDSNQDGSINLADIVHLGNVVFNGTVPDCEEACDVNKDGSINVADQAFLSSYIFSSGTAPPSPGATCGPDLLGGFGCADGGGCP